MKVQVSEVFKHDFTELKVPYSKQPEIEEHISVLPVFLCIYLCAVGEKSHTAERKTTAHG